MTERKISRHQYETALRKSLERLYPEMATHNYYKLASGADRLCLLKRYHTRVKSGRYSKGVSFEEAVRWLVHLQVARGADAIGAEKNWTPEQRVEFKKNTDEVEGVIYSIFRH